MIEIIIPTKIFLNALTAKEVLFEWFINIDKSSKKTVIAKLVIKKGKYNQLNGKIENIILWIRTIFYFGNKTTNAWLQVLYLSVWIEK